MSLSVRAGRVFDGQRVVSGGVLVTEGARVAGVVDDCPVDVELDDCTLVPGFVDAHCHGGGGVSLASDPATALALHRTHGTTSTVASLVSQSLDVLEAQVGALAPLVRSGELAGVHLEGPWLAEARKGAHPASALRAPTASDVTRLLDAGAGSVVMVTIAPELEGGLDAVALVAGRGVVAAVGHTDASYGVVRDAVGAGARGATHLFNAMPPLGHRAPGPVLALLDAADVWLELIADGVHLDTALVHHLLAHYGERCVLITDAMAAAGVGDGTYRLGDLPVDVCCGVARVAGTDTIAGSTLTLDAALRVALASGVEWTTAVRALTVNPADYLGLADVGRLVEGCWADAVALDADWQVRGVMRRGEWVVEP